MPFSHYESASDENGVCKVLGFEKAALHSSRSSSGKGDTLQVNAEGNIVNSPYTYKLSQLVCINKINNSWFEKSFLLNSSDLVHPDSNMPFSHYENASDENGVCKVLGFDKAALHSSGSSSGKGNTLQVNAEGNIVNSPYTYKMSKLVCLRIGV